MPHQSAMDDSPSRHRRGLPGLERLLGRRTRRWPPLSPPSPPSPSISLISSSPELYRPSSARSNDSTSSVFSVASHHPSTTTSPQESTITAAVADFPSVRYIPADHAPDVRWKHSDLRDVPLESHDALCHICLEDFTPPPLRDAVTTVEEENAAVLVQLSPCGHVFHVSFSSAVQSVGLTRNTSPATLCRKLALSVLPRQMSALPEVASGGTACFPFSE